MGKDKQDKQNVKVHVDPARRQPGEDSLAPAVDVYEAEDGTIVLAAEVPGAGNDKVDVRVEKGVLTIWADGTLPELGDDYARTYSGFPGGEYFRAFALSDEVDREQIEASLTDGVLTVRLPRAAAAKTRKIDIKPG